MNQLIKSLAAISLAAATCLAQAQSPVKIGFLATFTGPLGTLGQDQYDAFMLAVEQRGGKLGGVPVQVLKEDDQFKPEVGVQLTQKLLQRENVPIITGITGSNVLMAIADSIAEKEVFLISTNAGPSPLAGSRCSPYRYFVSWQSDNMAEVMGKYANDMGYKRVVLLAPNYQAGKDVLAGFKRLYKGEVADEFYTTLNQPDLSAEITQLSSKKPTAVFAFYPGNMGVNFVRQYQQAGLLKTTPLMTAVMIDGTTLPALKESALGITAGAFWGPDLTNPVNLQFVQRFEAKYKRIPSAYAAQAYDGALLLDAALAKVKGNVTDKKAFALALKTAQFSSVRGKFAFNTNNFPIHDMHVFEVAKDPQQRVSLKRIATPLVGHKDAYFDQCALK